MIAVLLTMFLIGGSSNLSLAAESSSGKSVIKVELGFGKVSVELIGVKALPLKVEELETDLLIDERIASLVTSNELVTFEIPMNELQERLKEQGLEWKGEDSSVAQQWVVLFNEIEKVALDTQSDQEEKRREESSENDQGASGDVLNQKQRVVMGQHVTVEEDEVLDELVVLAGSASIKGTVRRLVVMGGMVHLHSTAVISEELSLIGGHLEKDPGALVKGKLVEMGIPFSKKSWNIILDQWDLENAKEWLGGSWFSLAWSLLKIFILMVFGWLAYILAPSYMEKIYQNLLDQGAINLGWGLFSFLLFWPIMIFLLLTIVGIPLLPLQFSLIVLFVILGQVQVAQALVTWIGRWLGKEMKGHRTLKIIVGLVLLEAMGWVPYVGDWVHWLCILAGFGASSRMFYVGLRLPGKVQSQKSS